MKFSAALDLSGDEVCLALAREDGKFLLNINQPMHGRDSANLAKFVNSQLQAAQVDLILAVLTLEIFLATFSEICLAAEGAGDRATVP